MRLDIRPQSLNTLAGELAYEGISDPGRPSNAKLRSAVSTTYYALFHSIALAVVRQVLPRGTDDECWRLARSVEHGAIKDVCNWIKSQGGPEHASPAILRAAASQDVRDIAALFPDLQEARYGADYDHSWDVSKVVALSWVERSRRAVERLGVLADARAAEVQAFLGLIALKTPKVR